MKLISGLSRTPINPAFDFRPSVQRYTFARDILVRVKVLRTFFHRQINSKNWQFSGTRQCSRIAVFSEKVFGTVLQAWTSASRWDPRAARRTDSGLCRVDGRSRDVEDGHRVARELEGRQEAHQRSADAHTRPRESGERRDWRWGWTRLRPLVREFDAHERIAAAAAAQGAEQRSDRLRRRPRRRRRGFLRARQE